VVSSGCTQKTDFEFKWEKNQLTIYRVKEDYCKAMEEAKTFHYKLKDVKIDINKSFTITNEFIASPFMAKITGK
jgi:thiamine pyrophosphokinase